MRSHLCCLPIIKKIKAVSLVFLCFLVVTNTQAANIAAWDFTGSNNIATLAATVFDANLITTSGANNITRGGGASSSAGNNSFRTAGFSNNGISTANTDYFQITLTAAAGNTVSLSTIDASFAGTGTFCATPGVTTQFAYSINNGTSFTLIGSPVAYVGTPATMTQINVSSITALQNVPAGTTIIIRFYASGQTTTGGFGFNSAAAGSYGLAIGGSVVSCKPTAVTATPSATALCTGQTLTLTGAATNATSYSWTGPNSFTSTSLSPAAITTSTASTGVYTLNATNACGTTSVTTTSISVNPYPTIVVSGGATTICSGTTTTLGASGATAYVWSPALGLSSSTGSPVTLTGSSSTIYTVTGTSAGCSSTGTRSITVNTTPTVTVTPGSSAYCIGSSTTISASGANTYTWTPATALSATTGSPVTCTATTTTTYTVTGSSAAGCTSTGTQTITVNPLPTIVMSGGTTTICSGNTTTLGASGASTYSWSPTTGLSSSTGSPVTLTGTTSTIFTVTGTSAAGCTNTGTRSVTVNATPTVTVTPGSSAYCIGSSTTIGASGASTYTWTPATGLSATTGVSVTCTATTTTTYTVTGASTAGCTSTGTQIITVNPLPTVVATAGSATICNGSSTTISASGASTYSWLPATGLSATTGSPVTCTATTTTTYTVTGTSAAGCTSTTIRSITVNPLPTIVMSGGATTICSGNTTTLGASGASTYSWSPTTGLSSSTGSPVTLTGTTSTIFTVTGTSAAGCTNTGTRSVTVNATPTVTVTPGSSAYCIGSSTTIGASGASTYTWTPATGLSATTGSFVTCTATTTTTYTVTGASTAGCTSTGTQIITVNPLPTVVATAGSATICNGSSTTISASGASTYSWLPATGLSATSGSPVTCTATTTTTYTVTGTSTAGCTSNTTRLITVNPLPTIIMSGGATTICSGNTTTLGASGASTYSWSPTTGLSSSTGSPVTLTGTTSTIFTVTGTSAAGCTNTGTSSVTVNATPTITVTPGSSTYCIGSSTTIDASGASTYTWTPATGLSATTGASVTCTATTTTTYTVTGTSSAGCTSSGTQIISVNPLPTVVATAGSATICNGSSTTIGASGAANYSWLPTTGLSATTGAPVTCNASATTTYTITGASTAGCINTTTQTITVNPLPAVAASIGSSTVCNGSSTTVSASGANTYSWTPATGLSASTGSLLTCNSTATRTYTVTGLDINGCSNTATTTVNVTNITVSAATPTYCTGSNTTITAAGATTYTWSPATSLSATTGATVICSSTASRTYTVTGTISGCVTRATQLITVNPLPTLTQTAGSNAICIGASTTITAGGAVTYTWAPGASLSATTGTVVTVTPTVTTAFTLTGTDANGCVNTRSRNITVNALPTILTTVGSGTLCIGASSTITATGGTSYSWSPATYLSATTGTTVTTTPTVSLTYTVTGTNANGCTNKATRAITVNPLPTISSTAGITVYCIGGTTTISASGGATYTWSPATALNATTGINVNASPTVSTIYTITGTDANGCINRSTRSITVNPLPVITASAGTSTICVGSATTLTGAGGTTFTWSPASGLSATTGTTITASPTVTTTYTITGTNSNGCINTNTITITVNSLPVISSSIGSSAVCIGNATTIAASGAVTYVWSPATGLSATSGLNVTASPTTTTTYTITGTNADGCVSSGTRLLTVNSLPAIIPGAAAPAICNGSSTDMSATGALTYSWIPATGLTTTTGSSVHCSVSATTTYTVTGINSNGCSNTATQLITVNPLPAITSTTATPSICMGSTTTISVSGASTYSWAPATGLNTTTGSSVNCNASTTTTYTITGVSTLGCTSTSAILLTVNLLPVATFITTPDSVICTGHLDNYTTQAGNSAYMWTLPGTAGVDYTIISGGISNTDHNVSLKWLTGGIKIVYVNYTSAAGCTGLSAAQNTTTVNSVGSIAPITGNTSLSVGTTGTLANATPGGVWSSSNPSVITIDSVGNIHSLHVGSSMIHYTITNSCGTDQASILVSSIARTWVGGNPGHESNWNTNSNWYDHSVPDSTDDVVISAGATHYPDISASTTVAVRDLKIDSSVSIAINSGAKLKVKGNFIHNGVITGAGAVVFNNSSAQKISGKGIINNVEINNVSGVSIDTLSNLTVTNELALTSGVFNTNDSLTLFSDYAYTARIAPIASGASISGKIHSQQYIQSGYRRFRFWSHPFNSSLSLSQIQQFIDITGQGGAANGFTSTSTNAPSAFRHDTYLSNSALGYDPGWKAFTDISTNAADSNKITRHQAIRLFMRGGKGQGLGYGTYVPSAVKITMSGNVNQGTQFVHLAKGSLANQDINMIGNPYPSPVDIGTILFNAQSAGIVTGGAFYVWNESLGVAGQYQAISIGTSSADPYYLQANAAFQVRAANDNTTLVFNESNKGTDATTYLFKGTNEYTSLYVYDANYHLWDMLQLNFNSNATNAEDKRCDAIKLSGADLSFYSLSADEQKLTIDSRPYQTGATVPLGIRSAFAQDFIIRTENTHLPAGASLFLHDRLLDNYTPISNGIEYRFTISKDSASQGNKRFELTTSAPAGHSDGNAVRVQIYPNPASDVVRIDFSSEGINKTDVAVRNVLGVVVYSNDLGWQKIGSVDILLNSLASGIYFVEITSGDKKVVKQLIKE